MNLTCLNFDNKSVEIGDNVNIISEIRNMDNSVENLSDKINMLNYELLIRLNHGIKRKII